MLLNKIRGVEVLKSLESKAIRVNLANLKGAIWRESKGESRAIRVNFLLESNAIRHFKNAIQHKKGAIRRKNGATKDIMC